MSGILKLWPRLVCGKNIRNDYWNSHIVGIDKIMVLPIERLKRCHQFISLALRSQEQRSTAQNSTANDMRTYWVCCFTSFFPTTCLPNSSCSLDRMFDEPRVLQYASGYCHLKMPFLEFCFWMIGWHSLFISSALLITLSICVMCLPCLSLISDSFLIGSIVIPICRRAEHFQYPWPLSLRTSGKIK